MTSLYVRKMADLDADKAKYRIEGFKGTAPILSTANLDWKFPQERWLSGGILTAQGTHWGDSVSVQIVDVDNVLGLGAGAILDEFVKDYYMITDSEFQLKIESGYVALIPANVYLRIKYTNVSALDPVEFSFAVISHIPRDV